MEKQYAITELKTYNKFDLDSLDNDIAVLTVNQSIKNFGKFCVG